MLFRSPGTREPVDLAHGGKSHGLFHGEGVVAVEYRVVGVRARDHGVSI